jgi:dipeptidyl aminopeptidase/acylaminoacyl peptidase
MGHYDLFQKPADGATEEQPLLVTGEDKSPQDWSPDGRLLLYTSQDPRTGSDLWSLSPDGDPKPSVVVQTPFDETQAQFSPDGRWIAYASNETGRYEIYVRSFPGPGGKWQVSTEGGIYPRWRRDGKELFYVAFDNHLMAVPIQAALARHTVNPGAPSELFVTRLTVGANVFAGGVLSRAQYAVASDGRFLMNVETEAPAAPPITLVLNWTAALPH